MAAMVLKPRDMPRARRSRIGVGDQGEKSRLKVASRRRALRLGAAIVFQLEQGSLPCLFGLPRLKLLAAQFTERTPVLLCNLQRVFQFALCVKTNRALGLLARFWRRRKDALACDVCD